MKVRILSKTGDALAVTNRLSVEVDTQWNTPPSPDTYIMFDSPGMGSAAEILRKTNPIFGAGKLHDSLELNPNFGKDLAQRNGISTKAVEGPEVSIDAFYINGKRTPLLMSSVTGEGNAICRIWKKTDPKIYRMTLARIEYFLSQFHYTGPLTCTCVISDRPHFVKFIAHFQPHVLWAIGPWLPLAMGLEEKNGQQISYDWIGIMKVSDQPCFLSAEHKSLSIVKDMLRKAVDSICVIGKKFTDNLDALEGDVEKLKRSKYL